MAWTAYVNQTDLSLLGLYIEQVPGWYAGVDRQYPMQELAGRFGAVPSAEATAGPRGLRLVGSVVGTSIATRWAYERQLKALLAQGLVTVVLDDEINSPVRIDGYCERLTIDPAGHPIASTVSRLDAVFRCPDPSFYDLQGSILSFSTTAVPCPTGNAPHGGIVRIAAPSWSANVTDPTLTYLNAAGVSVTAMAFTGVTLVAGEDFLEIDLDRSTVTLSDAGVRSSAISTLTAGNTFFAIDPTDGDYANASYPQLKVTSTAGTPAGTLTYTRRWL